MAMMIAATDRGIGTGHSSVGDQGKARQILGVPNEYEVAYLLGVGYPADRPLKPIRNRTGGRSKRLCIKGIGDRSRYGMHADRKTSGVHAGHAGEPMQKPSFM
jgi:Nitroreductase family